MEADSAEVRSGSRILLQHEASGSLLCADGFFNAQPWLAPFDGAPPQGCVFELSVSSGTAVLPRELAVLHHLSSGTVLHTISDSTSDGAGVSLRSDERLLPTRHWQLMRRRPAEAGSQCLRVGELVCVRGAMCGMYLSVAADQPHTSAGRPACRRPEPDGWRLLEYAPPAASTSEARAGDYVRLHLPALQNACVTAVAGRLAPDAGLTGAAHPASVWQLAPPPDAAPGLDRAGFRLRHALSGSFVSAGGFPASLYESAKAAPAEVALELCLGASSAAAVVGLAEAEVAEGRGLEAARAVVSSHREELEAAAASVRAAVASGRANAFANPDAFAMMAPRLPAAPPRHAAAPPQPSGAPVTVPLRTPLLVAIEPSDRAAATAAAARRPLALLRGGEGAVTAEAPHATISLTEICALPPAAAAASTVSEGLLVILAPVPTAEVRQLCRMRAAAAALRVAAAAAARGDELAAFEEETAALGEAPRGPLGVAARCLRALADELNGSGAEAAEAARAAHACDVPRLALRLLTAPFEAGAADKGGAASAASLRDVASAHPKRPALRALCVAGYAALRAAAALSRATALSLCPAFDGAAAQLGLEIGAEELLGAVLRVGGGAARRAVSATATVARVAALLAEQGRRAALLELLCSLCAGSDEDEEAGGGEAGERGEAGEGAGEAAAVPRHQLAVAQALLAPAPARALLLAFEAAGARERAAPAEAPPDARLPTPLPKPLPKPLSTPVSVSSARARSFPRGGGGGTAALDREPPEAAAEVAAAVAEREAADEEAAEAEATERLERPGEGEVFVRWAAAQEGGVPPSTMSLYGSDRVRLAELCSAGGAGDVSAGEAAALLRFLLAQLQLFTAVCRGGHEAGAAAVRALLPLEALLSCGADASLPPSVHTHHACTTHAPYMHHACAIHAPRMRHAQATHAPRTRHARAAHRRHDPTLSLPPRPPSSGARSLRDAAARLPPRCGAVAVTPPAAAVARVDRRHPRRRWPRTRAATRPAPPSPQCNAETAPS